MKKTYALLIPALTLVIMAFSANVENEIKELELGVTAPMMEYKMADISGQSLSLADVKGENGTLVIFSCSTCPWVRAWEDRYLMAGELSKELGIGMIVVNPNEAIRNEGASLADMKKRAEEIGYNFPYVLDKDHQLADAFGATRTPHVYLMDKNNVLVFVGAIDDNSRDASGVENHYLADAMKALANGGTIKNAHTRALGCTIKRK